MAVDTAYKEHPVSTGTDPHQECRTVTRMEIVVIASIVTLFLIQAFVVLRQGAPFGHDESVYALRARDLVRGDDPLFYWRAYRAPGLPASLVPLWLIRPTEPFLRAVVTGYGAILLLASWWLGRTMFDRRTGLIAAAGLALTPVIIAGSTQVWPDIPGAALTTVTLAFYAWALTRPKITPSVVVVVPILVGVATVVRFGAPLALAPGLVVLTLWRREFAIQNWKKIVLTAALSGVVVGFILFVPLATAWAQTASHDPIAPYGAIRSLRVGASWMDGFRGYWERRSHVIDDLPRLVLLAGLLVGIVAALQRRIRRGAFLASITTGILTLLLIAASVHAEPRYLAPVFPWFWLASAAGIAYLTRSWTRWVTAALIVLVVSVWIPSSFRSTEEQSRWNIVGQSSLKSASLSIDAAAADFQCSVVSSYVPQVDWYSQCKTMGFDRGSVVTSHPLLPDGDSFLVIVDGGKRQPTDGLLQQYVDGTDGIFNTTGDPATGPPRYIEVYGTASDG
jgi:4-amino-4-deoxy-L-arabinose transferase-like glycosyltransferase